MTSLLKKTVEIGTLAAGAGYGAKFTFTGSDGKRYRIPAAGKTGTTENWSDGWTVGYTPYYTTAVWYGFDRPGNSLGTNQSGAALAGPVWGDYMREIHQGLAMKDFEKPATGIVDVTVCAVSGLLTTSACNEGTVALPFLEGTQPSQYCNVHGVGATVASRTPSETLRGNIVSGLTDNALLTGLRMPSLNIDLSTITPPRDTSGDAAAYGGDTSTSVLPAYNPFLDDESDAAPAPVETAPSSPRSVLDLPYNPLLD
jgi:penicillin-binding protein 1A